MARVHAALLACALALAAPWAARATATTPVQQVIKMLSDMKAKGESSMAVEKQVMADYTKWVNDRVTELGFEVKTAEGDIEGLIASIDTADSSVNTLSVEVTKLDAELDQLEADKKSATKHRETENAEYLKAQQDYSESVDALANAIAVLKSQSYDRPQAEMLLQKMAAKTPGMRRALAAFLEERADGAPAVAAYEFQSGGVIAVLEKLHKEFKEGLREVERGEANSAHAHDLEMLHISNTLDLLSKDREEKASLKGQEMAASSKSKEQLSDIKADLASDKKLLADTQSTFEVKKRTFEGNQQVRVEELEAIAKAIEIISNPTVAGSYSKHINMVQTAKSIAPHMAFIQEGSQKASVRAVAQDRAVELLRSRAQAISSKVLAAAAADAAENPFAKVVEMIRSLLTKLKDEAASEADHKKWCDDELKSNKLRRNKATTAVERLAAEVQELGAQIQSMADELTTLAEEQASLATSMTEASTARQNEKEKNEATIKDAVAAQEALKQALAVLHEFYAGQASLVQEKRQVPEMEAYKGMQDSKGGVVGMLEVIESDFARLETETRANEGQAADEYKEFMGDSQASKEAKHEREVQLKLDKDQAEFDQQRKKDDLAASEKELAAATTYYENLKEPCLAVPVSYEERAARRQEEIAALKEAYQILDAKSAA
mmetsp:Transcript_23744/g.67916  ORF Transcript_23744/g.67916 Transcript_23744/m.67916 type:complete len:665 (-) Transcript_23744:77-2071(-)